MQQRPDHPAPLHQEDVGISRPASEPFHLPPEPPSDQTVHGSSVVAGHHVAPAAGATTGSIAVNTTQTCQADHAGQGRCLRFESRELRGGRGGWTLKPRL